MVSKGMVQILGYDQYSVKVQVLDVCMIFRTVGDRSVLTMYVCGTPNGQYTLTRDVVRIALGHMSRALDRGFRDFTKVYEFLPVMDDVSKNPALYVNNRVFSARTVDHKLVVASGIPKRANLKPYQGSKNATKTYATQTYIDINRVVTMASWFRDALAHLLKSNSGVYRMPNRLKFPGQNTSWGSWYAVSPLKNGNNPVVMQKLDYVTTQPVRMSQRAGQHPANINVNNELGSGAYGTVTSTTVTNRLRTYVTTLKYKMPRNPKLPANGTKVAVKVQHPKHDVDLHDAVEESKVQQRLLHTGVVPILYASGYDADNNAHVSVMERVHGQMLSEWLEKRRTLPQHMFDKIENAVVEMWMAGIAHADLNPRNMMVSGDRLVIIDFGLSVALPRPLIPKTRAVARSEEYQNALLAYLARTTKTRTFNRGALDPHVLRWLHTFVV